MLCHGWFSRLRPWTGYWVFLFGLTDARTFLDWQNEHGEAPSHRAVCLHRVTEARDVYPYIFIFLDF